MRKKIYILFFISLILLTLPLWKLQASEKKPKKLDYKIVIDNHTPKHTLPAWLVYAGTKGLWIDEKFFKQYPQENTYRYSFEEEVEALNYITSYWMNTKEKDDSYLDDLVKIEKAKFMREYTWVTFNDPSWKMPQGLKLTEFKNWAEKNLKNHHPEIKAMIVFK